MAHLYRSKVDNICQSIWDKSEEYCGGRTCWGTHWELKRNIMGMYWEPKKNEKQIFPPPKPKRKKSKPPWLPSHWLHEISLPKRDGHHFWPQLIAFAKNTLPAYSSQETCIEMIHLKSSWEYSLTKFSNKFGL